MWHIDSFPELSPVSIYWQIESLNFWPNTAKECHQWNRGIYQQSRHSISVPEYPFQLHCPRRITNSHFGQSQIILHLVWILTSTAEKCKRPKNCYRRLCGSGPLHASRFVYTVLYCSVHCIDCMSVCPGREIPPLLHFLGFLPFPPNKKKTAVSFFLSQSRV